MSEAQFRAWLKNKLEAASHRPHYKDGKHWRLSVEELLADLDTILQDATERAERNRTT